MLCVLGCHSSQNPLPCWTESSVSGGEGEPGGGWGQGFRGGGAFLSVHLEEASAEGTAGRSLLAEAISLRQAVTSGS